MDGLPPELRGLAEAANDALRRLGLAYEREKRFVSDAAHQLRTPLTVLGLLLEEGRRGGKPGLGGHKAGISPHGTHGVSARTAGEK